MSGQKGREEDWQEGKGDERTGKERTRGEQEAKGERAGEEMSKGGEERRGEVERG